MARAIVFASTRDGGDFDLWRLAIDRGRAVGAPVALTSGAGHEVTPTVAADGTVVYAAVDAAANGDGESRATSRQRAPGRHDHGADRPGPADRVAGAVAR